MRTSITLIICLILISILGWFGYQALLTPNITPLNLATTTIELPGGVTITADIADTDEARNLGLSGRRGLAPNTGMLFVFDKPGFYGFWMKDMRFAIDIIWLNDDGVVVGIEKNAKPSSYPASFVPSEPVSYVLELEAGESDRLNISPGTTINLENLNQR